MLHICVMAQRWIHRHLHIHIIYIYIPYTFAHTHTTYVHIYIYIAGTITISGGRGDYIYIIYIYIYTYMLVAYLQSCGLSTQPSLQISCWRNASKRPQQLLGEPRAARDSTQCLPNCGAKEVTFKIDGKWVAVRISTRLWLSSNRSMNGWLLTASGHQLENAHPQSRSSRKCRDPKSSKWSKSPIQIHSRNGSTNQISLGEIDPMLPWRSVTIGDAFCARRPTCHFIVSFWN